MKLTLRLGRLDDERLARLVGEGDASAFEALYDRHHVSLLAFCRHMLGNREDSEDALQQVFVRAHRVLAEGRTPEKLRPWLFGIARNRCLTTLAARREGPIPSDDLEPSHDGLAREVERRAELRQLLRDLSQLPDDQRSALVLAELGDFSQAEIAGVIGCAPAKVKALVFQARTALIAERDARQTPCDEIRGLLETARAGLLRRAPLRRHVRQCAPCGAFLAALDHQRSGLAVALPVAPTVGLKAAVLFGVAGLDNAEAAVAAAALAPGSLGAAGGGGMGGSAVAGGVAVKAVAAKAALTVAICAATAGAGVAAHDVVREQRSGTAASEPIARHVAADPAHAAGAPAPPEFLAASAESVAGTAPPDPSGPGEAGPESIPVAESAAARRARRRSRRAPIRIERARARPRDEQPVIVGSAWPARRRHRDDATDPRITPDPDVTAAPAPVATERRHRRRRRDPVPAPTTTPTPTPTPTATPTPTPTATPSPSPAP